MAELKGKLTARQTLKGKAHIPLKSDTGGYYTPAVEQVDENTMKVSFTASEEGMPAIPEQIIALPAGPKGEPGYTPVKGDDYFDGKDGVSVTHEWDGTVLKVTSASGTTSADLRGGKGDPGPAGYTPVKGEDYYTDADKAEMVNAVIAALPKYDGEVVAV